MVSKCSAVTSKKIPTDSSVWLGYGIMHRKATRRVLNAGLSWSSRWLLMKSLSHWDKKRWNSKSSTMPRKASRNRMMTPRLVKMVEINEWKKTRKRKMLVTRSKIRGRTKKWKIKKRMLLKKPKKKIRKRTKSCWQQTKGCTISKRWQKMKRTKWLAMKSSACTYVTWAN